MADIFENQFFCKFHLLIIDFMIEELKLDCSTVYFYKKAQITFAYAKVMS